MPSSSRSTNNVERITKLGRANRRRGGGLARLATPVVGAMKSPRNTNRQSRPLVVQHFCLSIVFVRDYYARWMRDLAEFFREYLTTGSVAEFFGLKRMTGI